MSRSGYVLSIVAGADHELCRWGRSSVMSFLRHSLRGWWRSYSNCNWSCNRTILTHWLGISNMSEVTSKMTNTNESCTETTPISVPSDSTLGLPPSENRESGDFPRPQQSEPLEDVKEKNIKKEGPATESSQGIDNRDDEDVIRLNKAFSRLGVKGEDGPDVFSYCSLGSEALNRAPETTSSGSSVDPEPDGCGSKGSERLSESALESDGNVSDNESDIDSDGISSMSDTSRELNSREQLVARGPERHCTSLPRHHGKPYDRLPASSYVVTPEQDDDLMKLVTSPSHDDTLLQQSSPQPPLDQMYVDDWLDSISNDPSQHAQIGDSDQNCLENLIATIHPANTPGQVLLDEAVKTSSSDLTEHSTSSNIANFPNTGKFEYLACSPASTIPTVVDEKMKEQEPAKKKTRARTSRKQKNTPTPKKQNGTPTPRTRKGTPSASIPSTMSECLPSVQQQTPVHVQPDEFQPLNVMLEDAMSIIEDELRTCAASHGTGIHMSHPQMPLYSTQQFPVQSSNPLFSQTPQTTPLLPPVQQSDLFQVPVIIPTSDVQQLAIQSTPQQQITLNGPVLIQQPELPPPTSTQAVSYGTVQSQQLTSQPAMMTNASLKYLLPSSAQHKITTAGTLGATSCQLFAFPFQPVRPVPVPNLIATQTNPNISGSRFQKIVPKPT